MMCAQAQEVSHLGRSPRGLLMGDAYTAVVDDEYSLFYNPASLGRNKGVSFTPLAPSFGGTNALDDMDRFKDFPKNDPVAISERLLNYPVTVQASIFPGFKLGQFGLNLFATSKTNIVLRNAIHPTLDVDYRYDRGFIAGYAYNIGSGAFSSKIKKSSKQKITTGRRISFGLAVKHMNRQGINDQFDLFGTTLLNKINSGVSDISEIKKALGYSTGKAWGVDAGTEFAISNGRSLFTAGLSILDIGDTQFTRTEGTGLIPKQDMTINTGMAWKQDYGFFDYTLSMDIAPWNGTTTLGRKFHFGSELAIPLLSFHGGWSEGYLSYGATAKFWPVKVTAGFYGVEVGSKFKEQEAKRFVFYVSLFDFSIDL
jgi:hypothetical protein